MTIGVPAREALPGPPAHAFTWLRYWRGWFTLLESCQRRYGDVFALRIPYLGRVVVLADPESIRTVLGDQSATVARGARSRVLRGLVGGMPFAMTEGPRHIRWRRFVLPGLHGEQLAAYEPVVADVVARHVQSWRPGARIDITRIAPRMTADIITRVLFGTADQALLDRFRVLLIRLMRLWILSAMLPRAAKTRHVPGPWPRFLATRADLEQLIRVQVRQHRSGAHPHDVCAMLLAATDETGAALSDDQICRQLLGLAIAGSHTSSVAIAWLFEHVLHDATTLRRLEANPGDVPFASAVVYEALRIQTVVDTGPRMLARDLAVGDLRIRAGEIVFPSFHLVHRSHDLYDEADAFRPDRFLDKTPTTYGWLPFGGGVRRCIAAAFVQMEMRVILRETLRHWQLRSPRSAVAAPRRHWLFWVPKGGVPVTVIARRIGLESDP